MLRWFKRGIWIVCRLVLFRSKRMVCRARSTHQQAEADRRPGHGGRPPAQPFNNDVLLKKRPNRRFVEVAELAALALFLCTDNGALVTGVPLPMDGGWISAHSGSG